MIAPALVAALGMLLVLLLFRPPGWMLILLLIGLLLPGRWWHWKTRRFRRGVRLLRRGDAAAARSEFETFLFRVARSGSFRRMQPYFNRGKSRPYEVAALSYLGVCRLHLGEPEPALDRFRAALAIEPGWAPARYGEAMALRRLGDVSGSELAARQTLDIRPSYLAARLLLGTLLRESGRGDESEEVLRPVSEDGRDPEALLRALEDQWGIGWI